MIRATVTGAREFVATLDTLPRRLERRLLPRVRAITETLEGQVRTAAPVRTGRLRSEIHSRIYADRPSRIAGYVEVYAPGAPGEYAKAATMEYGSSKGRRIFRRDSAGNVLYGRHFGRRVKLYGSRTKAVHIGARRYLRGPLAAISGPFLASIEEATAETVIES